MELKSLYTVKKIIETGSYQKAAAALNYAQSTITFQIKQLEQELDVKLFEKNGTHMVLTDEGRDMLPLINQVITATDALLYYKSSQKELRGTLKIALPETLVTYQMQPILKAFKEKAPSVRLSLQVMNCYAIYEQLLSGDIDIAIHYDIRQYPQSITTQELTRYPLTLVASPELAEELADFVTPNQQKAICHIQHDPNALYLTVLNQYLERKHISLEPELEVGSVEAVKRSVMSNLGIAYLPRFAVETELEQGLLRELNMDTDHAQLTVLCAYHKNRWHSPAMLLFLDILEKQFQL